MHSNRGEQDSNAESNEGNRIWIRFPDRAIPRSALNLNDVRGTPATERHYIKDVPESTLQAMKLLEALCNECANQARAKPN